MPFFILFLQYVGDTIQPGIPLAGRATCQDGLRSARVPSPMGSWRQLLVFAPCKATVGCKSRGTEWSWRNLTKKISFLGERAGCVPALGSCGVRGARTPMSRLKSLFPSFVLNLKCPPPNLHHYHTVLVFFHASSSQRCVRALGSPEGQGMHQFVPVQKHSLH